MDADKPIRTTALPSVPHAVYPAVSPGHMTAIGAIGDVKTENQNELLIEDDKRSLEIG